MYMWRKLVQFFRQVDLPGRWICNIARSSTLSEDLKEVTKATVQTAEDSLKHKVEVMAAEEMAQVISSKYFHDATLTEMDNIGS
ncbi:hypothetical protein Pelo_17097 [Pelomyxa schiedti]|nr:hypothetical protein Pelo_17097 [Pelomyxa schiedti]